MNVYLWCGGILIFFVIVMVMCMMVRSRRAEEQSDRMQRRLAMYSKRDRNATIGGT